MKDYESLIKEIERNNIPKYADAFKNNALFVTNNPKLHFLVESIYENERTILIKDSIIQEQFVGLTQVGFFNLSAFLKATKDQNIAGIINKRSFEVCNNQFLFIFKESFDSFEKLEDRVLESNFAIESFFKERKISFYQHFFALLKIELGNNYLPKILNKADKYADFIGDSLKWNYLFDEIETLNNDFFNLLYQKEAKLLEDELTLIYQNPHIKWSPFAKDSFQEETDQYFNLNDENLFSEELTLEEKQALQVLGFSTRPNRKTLQKRYHELAKKYHPDLNNEDDIKMMEKINVAYNLLRDKKG